LQLGDWSRGHHPAGVMNGRCAVGTVGITMEVRARSGLAAARHGGGRIRVLLAAAVTVAVVAGTGCSSSSTSTTPAYCTDRTNLENSVKGLTSSVSGGISGLQAQVSKIESNATALVNSAKSDFPSQTSAITSSVNTLKSSVTALASNRSVAQLATVTKDATNVVNAVKSFNDATSSQCS
jgi:hypothetical protein